jgi:hypothetical protein
MPDDTAGAEHQSPATPEPRREPTIWIRRWNGWMRPSAGGSSQRAVWAASRTPAGPAWPCSRSATRYRKATCCSASRWTARPTRTFARDRGCRIQGGGGGRRRRHGRARRLVRLHPRCRAPPGLRPRSPINRTAGRAATGRHAGQFRAHHAHLHRRPPPAPPLTSRQHRQSLPALPSAPIGGYTRCSNPRVDRAVRSVSESERTTSNSCAAVRCRRRGPRRRGTRQVRGLSGEHGRGVRGRRGHLPGARLVSVTDAPRARPEFAGALRAF